MNIIFDSIVSEFDSSDHEAKYNVWFKAKVEQALADNRPAIPHDQVVARFEKRRDERVVKVSR